MELVAAACAAGAVFIGLVTLISSGQAAVASRLDRFERNGTTTRDELLAEPFAARVGMPVLERMRTLATRLLPSEWATGLERRLLLAGEPISLHGFLTMWLLSASAGALVIVLGIAQASGMTSIGAVLLLGLLFAVAPLYWIRLRVAARKRALLKALPDAVDLIVTTVEAGLGLDAALSEVGHETNGPLGEELRLTVRETTLGRSRRDALTRLNERTDVPELKTFVQSIIQAEQTGIPVGQVLRTQAAQIRLKKRQRAETEAQRAPVKMVVVLALLVLPAMLLMVIGPAAMRMADQF